jgi:hypothetical protein
LIAFSADGCFAGDGTYALRDLASDPQDEVEWDSSLETFLASSDYQIDASEATDRGIKNCKMPKNRGRG